MAQMLEPISRRSWLHSAGALLATTLTAPDRVFAAAPDERRGLPPARVRLSLNENPFGCSPRVIEAIRADLTELNRYTESEAASLAAQIAAAEGVAAEQIVVGDILQLLGTRLSLTGGPRGEFVYSTPGFTELVEAGEGAGGVGIPVPLDGALENDLPAIAAHVNARTRAVFLVNPHNPSGTVSDAGALESFVRDVSRRALVIVDEAYLEFTDDFAQRTMAARARAGDNVLVFRTFSKICGLAGLPLGYAIAPSALAEQLRRWGAADPHGLNRLAVKAASAALGDSGFVGATRDRIATERDRWHAALDRLGLRRAHARANFVFFDAGRPQAQVAAAFRTHGVEIGRAFPPLDHWVRISIGRAEENSIALDALDGIFGQRAAKQPRS